MVEYKEYPELPLEEAANHDFVVHGHHQLVRAGLLDRVRPYLERAYRRASWDPYMPYIYMGVDARRNEEAGHVERTLILVHPVSIRASIRRHRSHHLDRFQHEGTQLTSYSPRFVTDLTQGQDALIRDLGRQRLAMPSGFDMRAHLANFTQTSF